MTIHLFLGTICLTIGAICGAIILYFWATGVIKSDEKEFSSLFNKLFNIHDSEI